MKALLGSSRWLRRLVLFAPYAALIGACDRPNYTFSDDVPVVGTGNFPTGGPTFVAAGSATGGGASTLEACPFNRSIAATPILAGQVLSNNLVLKPQLYFEATQQEVADLKKGGSLIPKPDDATTPPLTSVLTALASSSATSVVRLPLITELLARFKATRAIWPNPWALRMVDHAATELMTPVQVTLKKDAWVVRLAEGSPTVVDLNNGVVDIDAAIATPERIAAIFYVYDDRTLGNISVSTTQCEIGKREIALGNEAMVEEFAIGTADNLARLNSDIDVLTAFFNAVRPCGSAEQGGGMTFHSSTVCSSWHFFDASTEYSAYQWSLTNPVEIYRPTPQNLGDLIQALTADRFEVAPFHAVPPVAPANGGTGAGGSAGMGGTAGTGGAGAAGGAGGFGGTGTMNDGGATDGGFPQGGI